MPTRNKETEKKLLLLSFTFPQKKNDKDLRHQGT
jgi:hypothetical protein